MIGLSKIKKSIISLFAILTLLLALFGITNFAMSNNSANVQVFADSPTAKAVFDSQSKALTFYYDTQTHEGEGVTVYNIVFDIGSAQDVPYFDIRSNVKVVEIDESFADYTQLTSTANMFNGFENLMDIIGLTYLNTSNVTNMSGMFYGCRTLVSVNLSNFNTEKVTNMAGMFYGCETLRALELSNFDTENVTLFTSMFSGCRLLTTITVSDLFVTTKAIDSTDMFKGCSSLVGENGTEYDETKTDAEYAKPDKEGQSGYFTELVALLEIYASDIYLGQNLFEYKLESISPVIKGLDGIDESLFEITGDTSATVVGEYSITITFKNGVFFKDMSRSTIILNWEIFVYVPIGVSIDYANVAYENTVYLFFAVRNNYITGTPTLKLWTVGDGEYLDTDSDCVTLELKAENYYIKGNYYYIYHYDELAMKQMTDDVYLIATCGEYKSSVLKYSVLQYCYNQLHNEKASWDSKNVAEKLLALGSAVQQMFYYRGDRLADANYHSVTVRNGIGDYDENLQFADGTTQSLVKSGETVRFDSEYEFVEWGVMKSADHVQKTDFPYGTTEYTFNEINEDMIIYGNRLNGRTVKINVENPDFGYISVGDEKYSEYTCRMFDGVIVENDDGVLEFYYDDMSNPLLSDVSFVGRAGGEFVSWDIPNMFTDDLARINDNVSGDFIITANIVFPMPKIALSGDGKTATFYFDKLSHSSEIVFDLDYGFSKPFNSAKIDGVTQSSDVFQTVQKVVFDSSFSNYGRLSNMSGFFAYLTNLTEIEGLYNLDTSRVTDMYAMFYDCKNIVELDLSPLDMGAVTDYSLMFSGCTNLTVVDLSSAFNNKEGASVSYTSTFNRCSSLSKIYLDKDFNADDSFIKESDLTGAVEIIAVDIDGITAKAVWDKNGKTLTFYYDRKSYHDEQNGIIEYPFEKQKITESETVFRWSVGLPVTKVIFDSSFAKVRRITDLSYMFSGFKDLAEIEGLNYLNTDKVTNMSHMFNGCELLETIDLSNFNTKNVTKTARMFYGCRNLKTIYVSSSIDFTGVSKKDSEEMFYECVELVGEKGTRCSDIDDMETDASIAKIDQGDWNDEDRGLFTEKGVKAKAVLDNDTLTFYYNDTVYLGYAWYDLPTHATGRDAWGYAPSATFITTVVFNESFKNYKDLQSTASMFAGFDKLTTIKGLEYLYTGNVVSMKDMFNSCTMLESLDLSTFNTENVTNMKDMFNFCFNLTTIDLSSFDTANCTDFRDMFSNCYRLKTIYVSNKFVVRDSVINNDDDGDGSYDDYSMFMFSNCESLTGEKGTTFSMYCMNGIYARIDGGVDNPGYFTEKA